MNLLALLFALSCPKPEVVNTSDLPWNDHDQKTLEYAKKRCGEIYPDAPCVKWFKKYAFQSYSVICGFPTEKE